MPVKVTDSTQRGTSPSKSLDNASKTSWGAQKGTTDPKEALAGAPNKHPYPVKGNG
jgi:hypothetical protein